MTDEELKEWGSPLRVLLDTHVAYRALHKPLFISTRAASAIHDSAITFVPLVTFWEVAIKVRAGKLDAATMRQGGPFALESFGFAALGIEYRHIHKTLEMPLHHPDPFDRLLIAQALTEDLAIVSSDAAFDRYGVERIW